MASSSISNEEIIRIYEKHGLKGVCEFVRMVACCSNTAARAAVGRFMSKYEKASKRRKDKIEFLRMKFVMPKSQRDLEVGEVETKGRVIKILEERNQRKDAELKRKRSSEKYHREKAMRLEENLKVNEEVEAWRCVAETKEREAQQLREEINLLKEANKMLESQVSEKNNYDNNVRAEIVFTSVPTPGL
jgi:hypothetical protein